MQDWLIVILVLVILGVLLDLVRRMRANRRSALRMSRTVAKMEDGSGHPGEERVSRSEFPSGGARVAARRDPDELPTVNQSLRESYAASKKTRGYRPGSSDKANTAEQSAERHDAPVHDFAEERDDKAERDSENHREPVIGDLSDLEESESVDHRPRRKVAFSDEIEHPEITAEDEPVSEDKPVSTPPAGDELPEAQETAEVGNGESQESDTDESEDRPMPDEVMIINVMARGEGKFNGGELLQAMLDQGLRFGDMDIFHRYETADGEGSVLFSVANMVVPGTFDLNNMEEFDTPGISMFLTLPVKGDSLEAYKLMVEAAQGIAQTLDGELKDEHRSVMTRQTLEHERQRVIEYDRKRRLMRG